LQTTGRDLNGSDPTTNVPIFTPTAPVTPPLEIMQYQVNTAVVNNPNLIAAASNTPAFPLFSGQGDGSNALAMAQLRNKTITAFPATPLNATFQDFLNNSISKLGVDSKSFGDRTDTDNTLLADVNLQRQSVSGVNLDEELTDMLRFQRAFEASSKMITTFDDVIKGILSLVN
ncbi:MAG: hypothetical protein K2X66_11710, partial [Cyanobacteria bacterium]|nr:hypothetical protein [Cyanobacteriota bacterium]